MVAEAQGAPGSGGPQPTNFGEQVGGSTSQWTPPPSAPYTPAPEQQPEEFQPPPSVRQFPQPQEQGQSQPAPTEHTYWQPGQPLPWAGSPDAPAMPASAPPPQVDVQQLHPAVIQAREQGLVTHFTAMLNQTADPVERQAIDRQYQMALREYRLNVQEQVSQIKAYQADQQQQQIMVNLVPMLREMHADDLARRTGVPRELLLNDYFTKQPLWNHTAMERQADWLAHMGYRQNVEQRAGRDAGPTQTGQAAAPSDIDRMSPEQFRSFREQVRKSRGAALYRVS
jgi:hypothetical protein